MDIDQALAKVGGIRRWSITLFCLISCAICMVLAWHSLGIVMIGWQPPHHCRLAEDGPANESVPMVPGPGGELLPSQCELYVNTSQGNTTALCPHGWTYKSKYRTIVTEWDLVCGQNYLAELSQTIMQVGGLAGEFLTALFIDRIGRKKIFIFTFVWVAAFGVGCSLSPNYLAFVIFQTLITTGVSSCVISGFLLLMELFDSSKRTEVGIGVEAFWVIDYLILPIIGYLALYWRHFELFISLSCLIWLIFIWILPESPIWLVANKRYDEAEKLLQRMARLNGVQVTGRLLQPEGEELLATKGDKEKVGVDGTQNPLLNGKKEEEACKGDKLDSADELRFAHLFTDSKLLRHTVVSMLLWFANMVVYYGIILFTPNLAGDRFVNFLMSALIEIPAYISTYFICKKLGRRVPTCVAHVMAGACLLLVPAIPARTPSGVYIAPLATTLALLGKFFICISFAIILLYTKELFPTNLRGTSGGISVFVGRLGSMAAPFAVYSAKTLPWLPGLIMGLISIVVGFITLCLPETRDCPLPQNLGDIHAMYRTHQKGAKKQAEDGAGKDGK